MPNGQDRRAEKARNRTPRKGRTIRMGKKLGAAPVEGRIDDVARELLPLMAQLSEDSWKRLGKWAVALAKAEGFSPESNVVPEVEQELLRFFTRQGILPSPNNTSWKPRAFRAKQLTPAEQREEKAKSFYRLKSTVEDLEQMRDKFNSEGDARGVEMLNKSIERMFSPAVQEQWEQWFEYYHQCNVSTDGQWLGKLPEAERIASKTMLKEVLESIPKDQPSEDF